jgi:thioester reductase-like protein
MAIFVTGGTGFLGSYVLHGLLTRHRDRLCVLVRAADQAEAERRLWQALQLHLDFPSFLELVRSRVEIVLGDITDDRLGLSEVDFARLVERTDSIIHIAASLNRKSAKSALNVNLRGTLQVLKLARAAQDRHGLRRFSDVSTSAVAGQRQSETVYEDSAIDWERSDYDPYARTKKFCEYMLHELLPEVPSTVFRPTIVMGDSRFPETTQFDMVRAYATFARMRVLPLSAEWRHDIVPADYVGKAIVHVHQAERPSHGIYHLSSGEASLSSRQIIEKLSFHGKPVRAVFAPKLFKPFETTIDALAATPRDLGVARFASLIKVFLPYVAFDTVFDNSRIVAELGEAPPSFGSYASPLLEYAVDGGFKYAYRPWPEHVAPREVTSSAA